MALGFQENSNAFLDDHRPYFTVNYWDTVYTPESEGIEFSLFTLLDGVSFEGSLSATPTRAELESALDNTAYMTSVLGYTGGAYDSGVTHSIYKYWGSGGLPGITRSKSTVLKFQGNVKGAQTVNLLFAGQGTIAVYKNGASSPILYDTLEEPRMKMELPAYYQDWAQFEADAGYASLPSHAFANDDDLEIYYWHNGEQWGGLAVKAIESMTYSATDTRKYIRNGAVVGASFFGIEAAGGDLTSTVIPYVDEGSIEYNRDQITTATLKVALTTDDQPNGFSWDEANRILNDNAGATTIKEDRRIEIVAGYAKASDLKNSSGVIAAAETYTRFTGHIAKIELADDMKVATIHCKDFASKMIETYDENFPDRLSYLANGYIYREGGLGPAYAIPAFDAWPLETAIAEYAYRAGIDSKYLGKGYPASGQDPNFGHRDAFTTTDQVQRFLRKLFAARYLGDSTKQIKLERNANYGNVGPLKKDWLPDDSEYLYVPEITRRCYDQATELAEHYGYNFIFDPLGRAYLRAGNNPDEFFTVEDADDGGYTSDQIVSATTTGTWGTAVTEPEALTAQYMFQDTADTFTIVVEGFFGRLDLYASIGGGTNTNGGVLDFDVEVWDGAWISAGVSGSISMYNAANTTEQHFYSGALRSDGTNACVFEVINLPFDRYRVTLDNGGVDPADSGSTVAEYRLNGMGVYYQDPHFNMYPVDFATDTNVLSLKPGSAKEDLRNQVIVVGSRKGIVADSAKLLNDQDNNPKNLDYEFNIAVASDPASIYDKNATTFVGDKRIAVIFDDKVSDSDFARWLALATLFRYRDPRYTIPVQTLAIPMLEIGDAIKVFEANQSMVDDVVWVQSFNETWTADEATVDITTSSYPEIPSYQPRLLPDIDDLFGGQAAGDLRVAYTNLLGAAVTESDLDDDSATVITQATNNTLVAMTHDGSDRQALTTTFMPETLWLFGDDQQANDPLRHRALVNNPYRKFWHVFTWDGSNFPTIQWEWEEGDGDAASYGQTYYDMPTGSEYDWYLNYRSFTSRGGAANPYYDPYSSEIGYFVNIKFDALIEGRYRVSIWDARRSDGQETPVAWLTNPQGAPFDPEDHWDYYDPQNDVEFNWDGVDNIGIWNRKQSAEYALRHGGSFGEDPLAVGAGFYAWNDKTTELMTQIGDDTANNFRGTVGDIRQNDFPYFTIGQYGQFYIKIEVINDEYNADQAAIDPNFVLGEPSSTVRSDRDENNDGNLNSAAGHTTDQVYIFTHLGEPTQCEITPLD